MKKTTILAIILVLVAIFTIGINFYVDLLWYNELEMEGVFWTRFLSVWGLRVASWLFFLFFLWINLLFTRRQVARVPDLNLEAREFLFQRGYLKYLAPGRLSYYYFMAAAVLSLIFASYTGHYWMEMQYFFNPVAFGMTDPLLGQDLSFYVFKLPFLRFLYGFLMLTLVITLLALILIYFVTQPPTTAGKRWFLFSFPGLGHISLIAALIVLLKAVDYRLKMSELLLDPGGYMFGAGYTEAHIKLNMLWILMFLAFIVSLIFFINASVKRPRLLPGGVLLLVIVSLVGGSVLPAIVQHFVVQPSEFTYEKPYLTHHIDFTRFAYGVDKFRTNQYPARGTINWKDIEENPGTFNNIRLWDYRPIKNTLNELQAIRPYYLFHDVDIDRYMIDGQYRQVMVSAREMDNDRLDERAQTWVNRRLQYTHGYGVTMSPVNEVSREGLPRYFVQDIPPVVTGGIELQRPGIYYGELTGDYIVTNSKMPEFDYPMGDENVQTVYEGDGGVPLGGLGRRTILAIRFGDYRILFSGELHADSRIKYYRSIKERVNKVAPFLRYDSDPYIVVNDGRLFWIQDAYTVSDRFPYSQPQGDFNYIRNSVKAVIDAYNGTVDMYVIDEDDPLVQSYSRIFPGLFRPLEEMPAGLRDHLRYPEDLFITQANVYNIYHTVDPNVFYNREDLWSFPEERYEGQNRIVEPYYVILQLPGREEPEFVLIQPFTPLKRNNMIAWLAAGCDGENYGRVDAYLFPKDKLAYGPLQIENRIDQNTEISEQLALWDQKGSRVIRGNLVVLPVNDSLIYVEPIYLEAEAGGLPELARVIVAFDEFVVMARTLEEGLQRVLGEKQVVPGPADPDSELPSEEPAPPDIYDLIGEANAIFEEAQESLKEGNWARYGELVDELGRILQELTMEIPAL